MPSVAVVPKLGARVAMDPQIGVLETCDVGTVADDAGSRDGPVQLRGAVLRSDQHGRARSSRAGEVVPHNRCPVVLHPDPPTDITQLVAFDDVVIGLILMDARAGPGDVRRVTAVEQRLVLRHAGADPHAVLLARMVLSSMRLPVEP